MTSAISAPLRVIVCGSVFGGILVLIKKSPLAGATNSASLLPVGVLINVPLGNVKLPVLSNIQGLPDEPIFVLAAIGLISMSSPNDV